MVEGYSVATVWATSATEEDIVDATANAIGQVRDALCNAQGRGWEVVSVNTFCCHCEGREGIIVGVTVVGRSN